MIHTRILVVPILNFIGDETTGTLVILGMKPELSKTNFTRKFEVKMWFADGEGGDYQISEHVLIVNGQIVGDEEPCPLQGDVNGDQNLNVLDIIFLVNLILDNDYDSIGDINSDNILNVLDVILLVNIILDN